MKMHLEKTYEIPGSNDPVKTCEDICIRDESTAIDAYKVLGATAEVIKREVSGDQLQIDLRVHPNRESVPSVIGSLIGYDALDYVQKTTYDFQTHTGVMETLMTHPTMSDKVTSKGSFNLRDNAPFAPRTVTWTLDVDVDAHVWPISSIVEHTIISELKARTSIVEDFNQTLINQKINGVLETSNAA